MPRWGAGVRSGLVITGGGTGAGRPVVLAINPLAIRFFASAATSGLFGRGTPADSPAASEE